LLAATAMSLGLVTEPAHAQNASANPLTRDSFPIGSDEGALCQVQAVLTDPAIGGMYDRVWSIFCRDAALPVGRVYALRGADAAERIARHGLLSSCTATAETAIANCIGRESQLPMRQRTLLNGSGTAARTTYVAQGIAAYDDALRLAIESIVAQRIIPGAIRVAQTSVGDAAALARVQVAAIPADQALAEGYRRNNSGDYADAAVYFEALQQRPPNERRGVDPTEFTLNRALQLSNLGDFGEAERLLNSVDAVPTADIVQRRLRRNFRAVHALNQGDYGGAIAALEAPVPPLPAIEADAEGVTIPDYIAASINAGADGGARAQLSGDDRLTPQERALLIDAQGLALRGTALRLTGDVDAARALYQQSIAQGLSVRNGRVTSIIRLRAQTMGELALADEAAGRLEAAETGLRDAVTLLETEYPETMALAAARAKLAAYLTRHDRNDDALRLYRAVIGNVAAQQRQLTGLYNQLAPYFRLLVERQPNDPAAASEFFAAAQLLVRPGVADTQAVLARELSGGSSEAASLFRQANTLARDIERARIDAARIDNGPDAAAMAPQRAELETRIANLSAQQTDALTRLAEFPQYRAVSQDSLTLDELRAALRPGEAYAKLTIIGDEVYGLIITATGARAWRAGITRAGLDEAVDTLRSTISVLEGGQYQTYPFDAETAHQLFVQLFGPAAAEIVGAQHLIFEPDGAMLRLPIDLLITDEASVTAWRARAGAPGGDPFDMRGVAWLARNTNVSTSVSALAFRNTRNAPPSRGARTYLGLGANQPVGDDVRVATVRAADPIVQTGCAWNIAQWNRPISAAELLTAQSRLGSGADILTGAAFTDAAIQTRGDLGDYRILHFATHGLVTPPRPECATRPALLTSFGQEGSDGLLSFDEIFGLRLDADLVILSACDTAGQASIAATRAAGVTTGGGSALDGLVRAFIGAGGRSVLASHWPAPDSFNATQRLIAGLFDAAPGTAIATALGTAQTQLMDEAATSHPFYWSGFAIIGDGAQPLVAVRLAAIAGAEVAATEGGR
jgi:CHAT domain-containing protein